MQIVIYGIGKGLEGVLSQLLVETQIIAYTDSYADIEWFRGVKFVKPSLLSYLKFDYLVVTCMDRKVAWKLCAEIHTKYNVNKEKIIPYYCCCNTEIYEEKKFVFEQDEKSILILGNSHAAYGIAETEMRGG